MTASHRTCPVCRIPETDAFAFGDSDHCPKHHHMAQVAQVRPIHFHAGHNDAGYLPESDVEQFSTFSDAASFLCSELTYAADSIATWVDDHDCDDVPCPTYGDDCAWQLASDHEAAAADLGSSIGRPQDGRTEWFESLSDGRSLPVSWWVTPCKDDCDDDDSDDDDETPTRYVRRFDGLGDVWEVRWHGGSTFNVYVDGVEVDVFTRYGDDRGNAPTLEQARQFVEEWAAHSGPEAGEVA